MHVRCFTSDITYAGQMVVSPLYSHTLPNMSASQYVNGALDVLVSTTGANLRTANPFQVAVVVQQCPPQGCYMPPPPNIGSPLMWSSPYTWANKVFPQTGQVVTIQSNQWIVLDISPPKLGCLYVYGTQFLMFVCFLICLSVIIHRVFSNEFSSYRR